MDSNRKTIEGTKKEAKEDAPATEPCRIACLGTCGLSVLGVDGELDHQAKNSLQLGLLLFDFMTGTNPS